MDAKQPSKTMQLSGQIPIEQAGQRLDQILSLMFDQFSRSRLQQWIKDGQLLVNGQQRRPKDRMLGGETVNLTAQLDPVDQCQPQAIHLPILYQDDAILVIDKPVGLVVHPAAGNWDGTLQNALLHHDHQLAALPRAGIVHRLDKDTSGLLVVARTLTAHKSLVDQLQARTIKREYRAIVIGVMIAGGTIEQPIGRHPTQRTRMAVVANGKPAVTHYRVLQRFRGHSLLKVQLETGRTHQIRVHLAHHRYPIVGDPVYGGRLRVPAGCSEQLKQALQQCKRQALHAYQLALQHPVTGEQMQWTAPLPTDLLQLLAALQQDMEPDHD